MISYSDTNERLLCRLHLLCFDSGTLCSCDSDQIRKHTLYNFLIYNELDGYMDSVYTLLSTHLTHYKVFFEPNVIRIKDCVYTKRITNFGNQFCLFLEISLLDYLFGKIWLIYLCELWFFLPSYAKRISYFAITKVDRKINS